MIDPNIAGRHLDRVRFPIDRSKLAELARAFHEVNPAWHGPDAARAAGFEQVPTPPTVTVLADHWRTEGALAHAHAIEADVRRLLHGEAAWQYLAPVQDGDELTAQARVVEVRERKGARGGVMTLVTIETEYVNQHGALAVLRRDTLIETGIPA
jgi:acyl dehydratase